MSLLIILTDKYPFGNGETYIETERVYWKKFDRVVICPVLVRNNDRIRKGFISSPHETLISTYDCKPGFLASLNNLFSFISLSQYFRELFVLFRTRRLSVGNIKKLFFTGILSNIRIQRIKKAILPLLNDVDSKHILLYSYWMFEPAIVGVELKDIFHCRLISRVHRYDLYEELQKTGYLPFRELVLKGLDRLYTISEEGKQYLSKHYNGKYDTKMITSRLGTVKKKEDYSGGKGKETVIVSCSNLIPVKRVDLIVNALKKYAGTITWYHFGDGTLRMELEEKIKELPDNVHAHLMGFTLNDDIQKFYSEHYIDAFVNVSASEGIPVSIMEAQSYGLPVIATDVGGTRELVQSGSNGVLLGCDFTDTDMLNAIEEVLMHQQKFKVNAKETWKKMSDSSFIYDIFFEKELDLLTRC